MQPDAVPSDLASASRAVLQKMARSWHQRAQVRKAHDHDAMDCDPALPDFDVALLPFADHPHFQALSPKQYQHVLSAAWLGYNAKTLDIETWVVSPFCQDVLAGKIAGLSDPLSRQIAGETLVDESFHVLLTVNAMNRTRTLRGLELELPSSLLIQSMRDCHLRYQEEWQQTLVRLAVAVVSEVFISDYLLQLSASEVVQPLHRMVVDAHRRDEAAHGVVFRHLARMAFQALSGREKEFFASILPRPVRWFAARDGAQWTAIFSQLGLTSFEEMVHDTMRHDRRELSEIDYSGVVELANELGITDMPIGRDAFADEGLLS